MNAIMHGPCYGHIQITSLDQIYPDFITYKAKDKTIVEGLRVTMNSWPTIHRACMLKCDKPHVYMCQHRDTSHTTDGMPEANKEEDEKECVDLNHLGMKVSPFRDHKVCLERTHAICEDPNSTSEEKAVAIEALKEASKSLNTWTEYYASIQQVHLDVLTTQRQRNSRAAQP
jgi:hypothetical protein